MSTAETAVQNNPASIVPAISCSHPDDVLSVVALPEFRIGVRFVDGTEGLVDLNHLIHSSDAGVFTALRDEASFKQVSVEFGAVTWANGLDLAPDAMYSAIRQHGEWKL